MLESKCNNILSTTMLEEYRNMYIMEIDSHLTKSSKTICNVFVDESKKVIHIYDDLKHNSTSIVTEMNRDLAIEFTSLVGVKYEHYRFILYYAPIKQIPFIVEVHLKDNSYSEVSNSDIYKPFYERAKYNKPLIYSKEVEE
ncbi:hypothetical protein L6C90_13495 [Staphylococcus aureus]|uniref:hypothetical protein n=1 Tax=Staphylococcus aureus TaxID=1280 RepID=UPI0021499366|nr:hypothetical protein [Staphylococcus aureus]MCE5453084.1 hypothetical protein [Staphylococcus pseudintermedius]MCQ9881910.1 hypothetical protein [Staphylococcus aureus]MCQ9887287.1 hypothetical protein [Staphylococcus aureus]MCQ9889889.1 hypothetical protein [Staphylococcus aureus]MCQ9891998.1 hypothetical protein [Staphylococcus aureus]